MIEHAKQFKPVFADKLAHLVCIISKQYNLFKPVLTSPLTHQLSTWKNAKQFKLVLAGKLAHLVGIISEQNNLFKPVLASPVTHQSST